MYYSDNENNNDDRFNHFENDNDYFMDAIEITE
jgi:hypothetical protein